MSLSDSLQGKLTKMMGRKLIAFQREAAVVMGASNSVMLENLPDRIGLEDIKQVMGDDAFNAAAVSMSIQELFEREKDEVSGLIPKEMLLQYIHKDTGYQGR
jgi:hypothetical protein